MPLSSFSCLIAIARIFCTMLNKNGEKTHLYFALDLRREIVYDFIITSDANYRIFINMLYQVEVILYF